MPSINKIMLMGHVGRDPEFKVAGQNNTEILEFSIATNERKRNSISKEEEVTWHNITLFARQAVAVGEFLKKGDLVFVEGKLRIEKYTNKDGEKKIKPSVIGYNCQVINNKPKDGSQQTEQTKPSTQEKQDFFNDDIPF